MKQWQCPKCGEYEIEEEIYPAKIIRYVRVDEYGDLDVVEEILNLPEVSKFSCSMCDYEFPRKIVTWKALEEFIGD